MPFKKEPPLYSVWKSMRQRCFNSRFKQFADYGGRGITVCEAWSDYKTFERDMMPRPTGTSIDRIDNDGPYSPENCRWATRKQQQRNQRRAVWVTIEGKRYRAVELSEQSGMKTDTIVHRAQQGLSFAEVMDPTRRVVYNPETLSLAWKKSVAVRTGRTHCKNGHEWTPENTRITPEGSKNCRACHRHKMRLRYEQTAR